MIQTVSLLLLACPLPQGPPNGYYDTVDASSEPALRATLHAIIDDHTRITYSGGATDTNDVLRLAQRNPSNSSRILDVYRNRSFPTFGGGYNREHMWPRSLGFPDDGPGNMPFSDCHMLALCDDGYNTTRSNKPYGNCSASCSELPTDNTNGAGGGSGVYPGNSNWHSGSFSSGTFEVNPIRRGDVARAMFYAAIRYEGGNHGVTGVSEPDLELTDNVGLIVASNTGSNESFAYMGRLSALIQWHLDDPVDGFERTRNDVIASFQGNRNPFVDHPEWVDCLFMGTCTPAVPGMNYCTPAVINSSGAPATLTGSGSILLADNDFTLTANQLPINQFGFFIGGRTQGIFLNPGGSVGNLCLGGAIGRGIGGEIEFSDVFGAFQAQVDLTAIEQPTGFEAAVVGETWYFQAWFRDFVFGQQTSNFTDGWTVTWQ